MVNLTIFTNTQLILFSFYLFFFKTNHAVCEHVTIIYTVKFQAPLPFPDFTHLFCMYNKLASKSVDVFCLLSYLHVYIRIFHL